MVDMEYWLGKKYDILAKQAEGGYQKDIADARSIGPLRDAQGFNLRAGGQQSLEAAATDAARRYMDPEWLRGAYRQLNEAGQIPPTVGAPGTGAPGTGAPGTGAPPPVQFQTLPGQPGASRVSANSFESPSVLTSPTAMEDMTPEQLAQWTQTAAAPQGVQGPTAPTGAEAQRRLADAKARSQPSLLRPTPVTTSKVSATSPLYSTGFKRGTANVKRQGLKKGAADVKPDDASSNAPPNPLLGVTAGLGAPGAAPAPAPSAVPSAVPSAPGTAPGGVVLPMAPPGTLPPPGSPGPTPGPTYNPPPMGTTNAPPMAGPSPGQPVGPGFGTPWNPNAMTGVENLGGIVDAGLRMVNPEAFNQALQSFRPSTNIEDRRGEPAYQPGGPTSMLDRLSNIASDIGSRIVGGGQALTSDIGKAMFGDRAAPGSLAEQAGYNNIAGGAPTTFGSILSNFSNPFGGAGQSAAPMSAAQLPAGSTVDSSPSASSAPASAPASDSGSASASSASSSSASSAPTQSADSATESQGLKKGSANVKGKGKGKAPPQGLEALLPMLMAAMQGGGGGGPPAGGPPAGQPPAPGFKKGSANVKGKGGKGASGEPPAGLEALLAAMQQGGGAAAGPPMAMAPGSAAPPGFAYGMSDVQFTPPPVPPLMKFAVGTPSVEQHPGYPFGAGYLFGATAVPGEGTGKVDTVPAMLAPHEAVLNRAAADMLGRGLIAALNARGVKEMGMHRGAAT